MRKIILLILALFFYAGCCQQGDNACYKVWYGQVPDPDKASGYRALTIGEYIFGEEKISEKNQKKP